ncbi:MAG: 50S ribosomal protein L15 [Lachnospiraceae bacterium]|nr:50S ribosomal protein L15 [Lachnospiraceae bacterium]
MKLSELKGAEGSRSKKQFRKGRGHGSGNGKTAGYGHKGQKARSGASRPGFEGGQMPLYRRLPKRGFKKPNRLVFVALNVSEFEKFDNGTVVTVDKMIELGMIKGNFDRVKILGNGNLTKSLTIEACTFSNSAKSKIEAAGGTCKTCEGCKEATK